MSVYVDELVTTIKSKKWPYPEGCHLLADSIEELHEFALSIGLKKEWFQDGTLPHYDLNKGMHFKALRNGAIKIDRRRVAEMIKEYREKSKGVAI